MELFGERTLKRVLHRGAAGVLNAAYKAISVARSNQMRRQLETAPATYRLSPEKVLEQTVFGVAPTMVHVVREITGVQFDGEAMRDRILEGVREGLSITTEKRFLLIRTGSIR